MSLQTQGSSNLNGESADEAASSELSPLLLNQNDGKRVRPPESEYSNKNDGAFGSNFIDYILQRARKLGKSPPSPQTRKLSSEYTASWFSKLFFTWSTHIVQSANFRSLEMNDFELMNPNRSAGRRLELLKTHLDHYSAASDKTGNNNMTSRPLMRSLFATYRKEILFSCLMCIIHLVAACAYHKFTWAIVEYLRRCSNPHPHTLPPTYLEGLFHLSALSATVFVDSLTEVHATNSISLIGGEMKSLLAVAMFEKSFTISPNAQRLVQIQSRRSFKARLIDIIRPRHVVAEPSCIESQPWTDGAILNAANTETDRVQEAMEAFHCLYASLIVAPLVIALGYWLVGWIGAMTMGVVILQFPIMFLLALKPKTMRAAINVTTEKRVQLSREIISGIRFIKFACFFAVLYLAWTGREHNASAVIPLILLVQKTAWINRDASEAILENASFVWRERHVKQVIADREEALTQSISSDSQKQRFKISNINLSFGPNELIPIFGKVASGKSSLLAFLIGAMKCTNGSVILQRPISYCPQIPWIQSTTVRENILLGVPMNLERYDKVVKACGLDTDFAELPSGDDTVLGELGINISGGQKQRIVLARTLYQNRQITLLDDVLSTVDAMTGEHLFQHAISQTSGCRVLVTHHRHFLTCCDKIVWIEDGAIRATGSPSELLQREDFAAVLGAYRDNTSELVEDKSIVHDISDLTKHSNAKELMIQKERAVHAVPWSLWLEFSSFCGPVSIVAGMFFILYISQILNNIYPLQAAWWADSTLSSSTTINALVFLGIITAHVFIWGGSMGGVPSLVLTGTKNLSRGAMDGILHAPISFFDTTPLGRIMNRFTGDINEVDVTMPYSMWAIRWFSVTIFIPLTVTYINPLFIPWFLTSAWILHFYKATPPEIKRIERLCVSRYISKFNDGIVGRASIKSANLDKRFVQGLKEAVDDLNSVHFTSFACIGWMNTRENIVSVVMMTIVGLFVLNARYYISPALGLVVIYYAGDIAEYTRGALKITTVIQKCMNAVERLKYYYDGMPVEGKLTREPPRHFDGVPTTWPQHGKIEFRNVALRYRSGLPLVLSGINLNIQGGQRIGIVGRTGAGKSSMLATLPRVCELDAGQIIIDGIDISSIRVHDLQNQIAVTPQDPTLFQGTIRSNLDPTDTIPDSTLIQALQEIILSPIPLEGNRPPNSIHLNNIVEQSGQNFSTGQRQLISLARAIVRKCEIILIDEATASVDHTTDLLIQESMRRCFEGCTVLTIAHRLPTALSYDKICVLEAEKLCEFGNPRELWDNKHGLFHRLCERSNIGKEDLRVD